MPCFSMNQVLILSRYADSLLSKRKPQHRVEHSEVTICTPRQAYGVEADMTLFVGLDAESWSMKAERIPWVDDAVRVELGLTDGDLRFDALVTCSNPCSIPANKRLFSKQNMMNPLEIQPRLPNIFQWLNWMANCQAFDVLLFSSSPYFGGCRMVDCNER